MVHPRILTYQGGSPELSAGYCVTLPPSKSQLIRRLFIHSIRNLPLPMSALDATWPQDVGDAWALLKSFESRRQQGQHQSEEIIWEAGEAGTVMRFGLAFLVAQGCGGILTGTARACQRPIGDLVMGLRGCGAQIEYLEKDGYPPMRIRPSVLFKKDIILNAGISSQFISAMIMIAPLLRDQVDLIAKTPWIISWPADLVSSRPYLELTVKEMNLAGHSMEWLNNAVRYKPNCDSKANYKPDAFISAGLYSSPDEALPRAFKNVSTDLDFDLTVNPIEGDWSAGAPIEGDWSAASFWIWRQAVIPLCNHLKIQYLKAGSLQADRAIVDLLPLLAPETSCSMDSDSCTLSCNPDGFHSVPAEKSATKGSGLVLAASTHKQGFWQIPATDFPDMVPSLVIWSVLSGNPLNVEGIGHLRYKESDRLHALAVNLDLLGIPYEILGLDGLAIRPISRWKEYSRHFVGDQGLMTDPRRPIPLLRCFGDHRMAMALSMLVLPDLPIPLDEPHVVRKSYPGFWEDWAKFGYILQPLN